MDYLCDTVNFLSTKVRFTKLAICICGTRLLVYLFAITIAYAYNQNSFNDFST